MEERYPPQGPEKVLYLITKATWGGAQRYVLDLAKAMRDAGHDVAVAYGAPGRLVEELEAAGIRAIALSDVGRDISLARDLRAFKNLLALLNAERPDVLHVNSSKAGGLGALAGRLARVPRVIFTAHGWAWNEGRPFWQKLIIRALAYATVLLAHETICVSNAMKKDARWMLGCRRKLVVIKNGLRAPEFLPKKAARAKLAPDAAQPLWLGMLSELHPTKRVKDAVEAMALITKRHPDALLVVMGDGEEYTDLELLIHERDLDGSVVLAGFVPDGARYLKAFDMFLHASRSESFCLAVAEAGLAGLPVVATRVGGIPEIIESRKSGLLVPPLQPALIAMALGEYIEDPARAVDFGAALRDRVAERFSPDRMIAETARAYFPHASR